MTEPFAGQSRWMALAVLLWILGYWAWQPAYARTWTDRSGSHQINAELESYDADRVWLRCEDGGLVQLRLVELSQADQDFVAQEARKDQAQIQLRREPMAGEVRYGPGRVLAHLADPRIEESSGLAASRRQAGWFWTHNDSGDKARLYLFDSQGRDRGSCRLADTLAFDWEDLAWYAAKGRSYLLVCDTGNNSRAAAVQMIHVIEEPPVDPEAGVSVREVPVVQTIFLSYEDDHRDCEAVAVDPTDKTILLASKEKRLGCHVYRLAWPEADQARATRAAVARHIAWLALPPITGMDISPDGRRAVLLGHGNAYQFVRGEQEDWAVAFSRPPREIVLPRRAQGEAICFGLDGRTLYLGALTKLHDAVPADHGTTDEQECFVCTF